MVGLLSRRGWVGPRDEIRLVTCQLIDLRRSLVDPPPVQSEGATMNVVNRLVLQLALGVAFGAGQVIFAAAASHVSMIWG